MTTLFQPVLTGNALESTKHRLKSLFQPIQQTNHKRRDVGAYLLTPLIDLYLQPIYSLDASINFLNATLSMSHALYMWTMSQNHSLYLLDGDTSDEFNLAVKQYVRGVYDLIALAVNSIISMLCLVTRPLASVVHACVGEAPSGYSMG